MELYFLILWTILVVVGVIMKHAADWWIWSFCQICLMAFAVATKDGDLLEKIEEPKLLQTVINGSLVWSIGVIFGLLWM